MQTWRMLAVNDNKKVDNSDWMSGEIPYELFLMGGPRYVNGQFRQVYKTPFEGLYVEIVRI